MAEPCATWELLEALAERVRGITRDAGFLTDLGLSPVVLDGEQLDDSQPGTVIEAGLVSVTSASPGIVNYDVDIVVEFSVARPGGAAPPEAAAKQRLHMAVLDLASALLVKPKDLPRWVRSFEQTGGQLDDVETESGAAFLVAQVTARAGLTQIRPQPVQ